MPVNRGSLRLSSRYRKPGITILVAAVNLAANPVIPHCQSGARCLEFLSFFNIRC